MLHTRYQFYFLFLCLAVSLAIVYFIIQSFLGSLILAAVFAFLFQPVYRWLLRFLRGRQSLAAFITTIIAIILAIVPIIFLGVQIFKESNQLYNFLAGNGGREGFIAIIESFINQVRIFLSIPASFEIDLNQYMQQGLDVLVQSFGFIFSSLAKMTLNLFVFLTTFYFLLKDGNKLKNYFVDISPLHDNDDEFIVARLKLAISSVMKGSLFIGLIQGILAGIGFTMFGVPNAVLWGSVAAIAALIPGVGTALVVVPATIFLFFTGSIFGGIGLLISGITAVGLIDNFLGPKLVGRGMRLHPLAVFLSVLGGIAFFGPLGFLLGPLAMSLCIAFIEIYLSLRAKERKEAGNASI